MTGLLPDDADVCCIDMKVSGHKTGRGVCSGPPLSLATDTYANALQCAGCTVSLGQHDDVAPGHVRWVCSLLCCAAVVVDDLHPIRLHHQHQCSVFITQDTHLRTLRIHLHIYTVGVATHATYLIATTMHTQWLHQQLQLLPCSAFVCLVCTGLGVQQAASQLELALVFAAAAVDFCAPQLSTASDFQRGAPMAQQCITLCVSAAAAPSNGACT